MKTLRHIARIPALIGLTLTLAACVATTTAPPVEAAPRGKPIVIANNRGGNVIEMVQYRNKLAASGRPVEIRGYCGSACTILITMPNACLAPDGTVGFHAPRIPNTTIIPPLVDEIMARFYRNGILDRWNSTWKHSLKIQKISAKEYVRLDPQTRLCRK
ncbi:hypothetical protein [Paracoccus lutimaris]|uniref:Lipoprotein n=1 Tax=Paracoccus lutimaris TaxID=1490030 RepID=A0A368YT50_9RHOB|nr:hypothetical protein [Paracoccus lutimaris]RCW82117.1 hypothetical protein DFP89_11377 [Paracoccus lutimaris]